MADQSFFYTIVDPVLQEFANEEKLALYSGVDFVDKDKKIRVDKLNLRITTHRFVLSNHPNLDEVKQNDSQYIYFMVMLKYLKAIQRKTKGIITKELDHLNIDMQHGRISLYGKKYLEGISVQLQGAMEKKAFMLEQQKQQAQQQSSIYLGIRQQMQEQKKEVAETKSTIQSSFQGDVDDLFKNSEKLQQISAMLRAAQSPGASDDLDSILQKIGCFQIVTKDLGREAYYTELAKQLWILCSELFPKFGGIISLLDLYYYFNKKRTMSLLSPDEVVTACDMLPRLNFPAKLTQYEGIKVLESTQQDPALDFNNTLGKHMSFDKGISAEQLAKRLRIPVLITRIKLQNAVFKGQVCVDKRIEGTRYYLNLILAL